MTSAAIKRLALLLCLFAFYSPVILSQDESILTIVDPVTDLTGTLNRSEYYALRKMIIQFEDSTSNQIVIVMIPSLQGDDIRDLAIRMLEKNKIGQQGKDNGILILVAKEDRELTIEVGYGLEGVLTDALCDNIIRTVIRPRFRENDYFGGLSAAVTAMTLAVKGEYYAEKKRQEMNNWLPVVLIIIVIVFSAIASIRGRRYTLSSRGQKSSQSWWWGGGGGFGSFGGGGGGGWSAGGGSFGGGGARGSW